MTVSTVVAVYDSAAEAFSRPFFVPTRGMAVRSFTDEVNRDAADNPMFGHPADYELFAIGDWDDKRGFMQSYEHVSLCRAQDVKV